MFPIEWVELFLWKLINTLEWRRIKFVLACSGRTNYFQPIWFLKYTELLSYLCLYPLPSVAINIFVVIFTEKENLKGIIIKNNLSASFSPVYLWLATWVPSKRFVSYFVYLQRAPALFLVRPPSYIFSFLSSSKRGAWNGISYRCLRSVCIRGFSFIDWVV